MEDLQNLTLANLREIAKNMQIASPTKYKKSELIEVIKNRDLEKNEQKSPEGHNEDLQKNSDHKNELIQNDVFKNVHLDSGISDEKKDDNKSQANQPTGSGVLEILPDGYGFLRGKNYLSSDEDVYVPAAQIKRFRMKTGDYIEGIIRKPNEGDKFPAILYVNSINEFSPDVSFKRKNFDNLTPIFPKDKFALNESQELPIKILDIIAPIGKGQRGLIVAPPKAGKTTLLKNLAKTILDNHKECEIIVLLIDERPEEVTDIIRFLPKVDVVSSTFDQEPSNHIKVAEMVLDRSRGLVEFGKDVVVLMDSITRLARAYNLTIPFSGKTLSGGLDPASLYGPKKFFGAARNVENGGSLTIIGTCLVDTGSRMDELIYEEFKGTGNMELILDRTLAERRIFPSFDVQRSGTRKDEFLLSKKTKTFIDSVRKKLDDTTSEAILEYLAKILYKNDSFENYLEVIGNKQG